MNILAINPGHNGSAAYLVNGEIDFYIEEERLSRSKYDGNPFRGILLAIHKGIDALVIGGTSKVSGLPWTGEDPYTALVRKFLPDIMVIDLSHEHHLGHVASAFYNSGFKEAAAVIVDGAGSRVEINYQEGSPPNVGFETESIYDCSTKKKEEELPYLQRVYKRFADNNTLSMGSDDLTMDSSVTIVKAYEAVSEYLGFGFIEAGKTMGLAPYGEKSKEIPNLFEGGLGNKNVLIPHYPAGAFIDHSRYPSLSISNDKKTLWHTDSSQLTDAAKNLAWAVQDETQTLVGDLIEKAVKITGKKNIVIAGGYGLNCVANYYYQKRFPDLNIFVDPVSHDGGTAIGLAKLVYHQNTKNVPAKLSSLYLGPEINPDLDLINIEELVNLGCESTENVKPSDVAKLISEKNTVAIFQGRSEAGPRALGNRSILYDPTDPQGKDYVNKVKGREWFRPFAGSILQEDFEEWFDTYGLKESPYMMYAMDFKLEKHGECPAITHVDGTCRIQTVTKKQNPVYYSLIKEFKKITGVPIVFNTSFNLAGEPLVESLQDAIETFGKSQIDYLYLPDYKLLFKATSQQTEEDSQTP